MKGAASVLIVLPDYAPVDSAERVVVCKLNSFVWKDLSGFSELVTLRHFFFGNSRVLRIIPNKRNFEKLHRKCG